ncbi:Nose resistant to fluoxetine protein 6 [Frankliniella fusca]|uniref:Nose resistant to fluoxetine protein 6 n=1 Tax=Frankliniella fusca TaxID=407009 RepID=A0AAE1HNX3_9NEOP|nr:Nose resistant to fluoxetine protein 6 [Frankliniella fusca]
MPADARYKAGVNDRRRVRFGPCADVGAGGDRDPRSLWPFFRDLDLLLLLRGAADGGGGRRGLRGQGWRRLPSRTAGRTWACTSKAWRTPPPGPCRGPPSLRRYAAGASRWRGVAPRTCSDSGGALVVAVWDASVRAPRGALGGELWQFGGYDECLGAAPRADLLPGAAYCLAKLRLGLPGDPEDVDSAWGALKPPQHRLQVRRHETHWGMCVPASCGPLELPAVLEAPLRALAAPLGLDANLTVDPAAVERAGPRARRRHRRPAQQGGQRHAMVSPHAIPYFDRKEFVLCAVGVRLSGFRLSLSAAFVSSVYCRHDSRLQDTPDVARHVGRLLLNCRFDWKISNGSFTQAFSVRRNWRILVSGSDEQRDDIACLHAAKVICLFAVIFGHRGEALMASPLLNANDLEKVYSSPLDLFFMNGTSIVDMFFVAGGCLLSWTLIGLARQGKQSSLLAVYFFRYARLVPAYAAAIAFLALGLPALGSGPLWGTLVLEEAHRCQQRWWTNLLFINNLVRPDEPCLDPAWYLACDMQLFLVLTPVVLLIPSRPRLARSLLALSFLIGVLYPAGVTWWLRLDGTIVPTPSDVGHMAATPIHMHVYVSALARASPYAAGVAAGWYLRHLQARAAPVPRALRWSAPLLLLLAAAAVALGTLFMTPTPALTPLWTRVAYAGLHRGLVGVAFAACVIAATAEDKAKAWAPLLDALRPWSRLTYCAYCTHALVQLYLLGQLRAPLVYSTLDTVAMALADTCFAFLAALVLHLFVEAPFSRLLSCLRRGRGAPDPGGPRTATKQPDGEAGGAAAESRLPRPEPRQALTATRDL